MREGHISSCAINHVGSSCAMEQEVALKLWQRYEDNGFRYTTLSEGILKSHSLSALLNFLRAFGDGPVAGVSGGQGIESWLAYLEFEPSATKDPPCRAAMHVKSIRELKCPLVGVVWWLGEGGASSGVALVI
ncbi:hypothetical protein TNCV_3179501 [Trichonephila clavipes]|nr:hypothetical protein TNCV_3179501 [Trichonephila clavipes]